jgi:hypothetical protein
MSPKDNLDSWQHIREFIEHFPDDEYWSKWKPMARFVVSELKTCGAATLFRIGQSMHHIIFSTSDRHGLRWEARVTLEFDPAKQQVRVAYSCSNLYFGEPLSEETVEVSSAPSTVRRFLQRLWTETKPDVRLPEGFTRTPLGES